MKNLLELPTFLSRNGITMVEGKYFDWEKSSIYADSNKEPFMFILSFNIPGKMDTKQCFYFPDKKLLSIGNSTFEVDNYEFAELICLSMMKGENRKIMPLYEKIK